MKQFLTLQFSLITCSILLIHYYNKSYCKSRQGCYRWVKRCYRWRLHTVFLNYCIVGFLYSFEKFVTVKCVVDAQLFVSVSVKFCVFLFLMRFAFCYGLNSEKCHCIYLSIYSNDKFLK